MICTNPKFYTFGTRNFYVHVIYRLTWNEGIEDWKMIVWHDWDAYVYRDDIDPKPIRGNLKLEPILRKLELI